MKPGDLMKISNDEGLNVYISGPGVENTPSYPCGTPVIFLGWYEESKQYRRENKASILIDGKVGWVYESELEDFDEAG